jgi:hypothetical protein
MTTLAQAPKQRKVKPSERRLSVGPLTNGLRTLLLKINGATFGYYLREIPVDFGRGFELDKFQTEAVDADEQTYHVHLDAQLGDSCTCKGHTYRSKCKHLDAVKTLLRLGKL